MKFVIAYTLRDGGSAKDRVSGGESAQKLLSDWAPSGQIHQWLQRADGEGGFAVAELDSAEDLYKDLSVWGPWLSFEVYPVVDIGDATPIQQQSIDRAKKVL